MNRIKILIISLLIMNIFSCNLIKEKVDLIVLNTKIYTVDKDFSIAKSFAVKNGKFLDVGTDKEILNKYSAPIIYNAIGKTIYPGFIDGHCHFYNYGLGLQRNADLIATKSFEEVLEIIKKFHNEDPSEWITGRGWDQNDWKNKEFPDKNELDKLFPNNPVLLTRVDGHAALVNLEALKRAGITGKTKVEGGVIKLKDGKPTGILIDNAIDLVREIIPKPDKNEQINALIKAQDNCFAVGLTSIVDAYLDKEIVELIDSLHKCGDLKIRIYTMLSSTDENIDKFVKNGPYKTDHLTVRSIKLFADGALGSRGALLMEPYNDDPDNIGLLMESPDYYRNICEKALKYGYQVNTHAIGDSGVRFILNIYSEFLKDTNDLRWRIEHSQVVHPDDFKLFKKYSIIPSVQPTHATSDMYWAEYRLGEKRIKGAYAYKELLQQNGWIISGTDFPVEDINPLYTFYAAVARKDLKAYPENGFQMENALTREEALKSMTIWAAKGSFEENEKGSIEPGKNADFVVFDKDIMKIEVNKIPDVKVIKTFVGGEEVYSNE